MSFVSKGLKRKKLGSDTEEFKIAKNRSAIYQFLSVVFLQEPTEEFIEKLKNYNHETLSILGNKLSKEIQNKSKEELAKELALEYTRLFIGPGKRITPYESTWRDKEGLLWTETTSQVKRFIESSGLEYRSDWMGIPDHIGAELEFMCKLTDQEKSAWEKKDERTALRCLELEKEFIDQHLSQWVPVFCKKVMEESRVSFYQEIANLTKKFIEFDKELINDLILGTKTRRAAS